MHPDLQFRLYTDICPLGASYSVFDSALYRNLNAEWLFPQEKATLHNL
jgi:hypothetical protein